MNGPLVTCVCLTRDRREWLPKAIDCFLRQTYEPRELLVVETGDGCYARDVISSFLGRPELASSTRIDLLLPTWRGLTVGALRNMACEVAQGSIIANWDDDDYSAPGRLDHQVRRLAETDAAMTGFHSMKFTDGKSWWQYRGAASYCLGTSLCFLREWWILNPFLDMQVGQDEQLSMKAASQKLLASDGDLDLMYATIHAGNTSPRPLSADCYSLCAPSPLAA